MTDRANEADQRDKRDNRRVHRWAIVGAGLAIALGALAFGAWWLVLSVVLVTLAVAIWAMLS